MLIFLKVLTLITMFAVAGVVAVGLFIMVRGKKGDGMKSNKLMWLRIIGQALALVLLGLFALTAYLQSQA
jgi:hypothetical protein